MKPAPPVRRTRATGSSYGSPDCIRSGPARRARTTWKGSGSMSEAPEPSDDRARAGRRPAARAQHGARDDRPAGRHGRRHHRRAHQHDRARPVADARRVRRLRLRRRARVVPLLRRGHRRDGGDQRDGRRDERATSGTTHSRGRSSSMPALGCVAGVIIAVGGALLVGVLDVPDALLHQARLGCGRRRRAHDVRLGRQGLPGPAPRTHRFTAAARARRPGAFLLCGAVLLTLVLDAPLWCTIAAGAAIPLYVGAVATVIVAVSDAQLVAAAARRAPSGTCSGSSPSRADSSASPRPMSSSARSTASSSARCGRPRRSASTRRAIRHQPPDPGVDGELQRDAASGTREHCVRANQTGGERELHHARHAVHPACGRRARR